MSTPSPEAEESPAGPQPPPARGTKRTLTPAACQVVQCRMITVGAS
jgi:hypothetical protein